MRKDYLQVHKCAERAFNIIFIVYLNSTPICHFK